ncbi:MAG TPA: GGDEF domain-containing protein [Gemmatimonadales bacterium]|nr:GGDEF domain-containing protein [Gemmatimonadales bacterium]
MVWHIAVVVVMLATGYDLYLRLRAPRGERVRGGTDELTRLENRRAFYELAGREFERARRYGHPFTIAYFDLDDFREVSHLFPHQVGDELLRLVAGAARRSVRASDVVARLGGDQYALLLVETGPDAAGAAVKKLQQTLQELSEETGLPLSVSGGVVTCLQPTESLEAAIGAADRLLHGAKAAGRDTFWSEVIVPQPVEAFEPTRLRRANRAPPGFDVPMPPPRDRPF